MVGTCLTVLTRGKKTLSNVISLLWIRILFEGFSSIPSVKLAIISIHTNIVTYVRVILLHPILKKMSDTLKNKDKLGAVLIQVMLSRYLSLRNLIINTRLAREYLKLFYLVNLSAFGLLDSFGD